MGLALRSRSTTFTVDREQVILHVELGVASYHRLRLLDQVLQYGLQLQNAGRVPRVQQRHRLLQVKNGNVGERGGRITVAPSRLLGRADGLISIDPVRTGACPTRIRSHLLRLIGEDSLGAFGAIEPEEALCAQALGGLGWVLRPV